MTTALLLVDIQKDYFPGGALPLEGMTAASQHAAQILDRCRTQETPVYHVQHLSTRPGATFFLPETAGVEIHENVTPRVSESVIEKHFPNSFRQTDLLQRLHAAQVQDLVICGAMSHMCIDATVRAAFDHGFNCTVIADACATRSLSFQEKTIAAREVHAAFMAALQVPYARVVSASEWLNA